MKRTTMILAACGLALAACDTKNSASNSGAPAPASNQPSSAATPAQASTPTTPAPATNLDRESAEGTVNLFVQAMGKADYETALTLVDDTCGAFDEVMQAQEAVTTAENNPNDTEKVLAPLMVLAFTQAWKDVRVEKLGESDGVERFQFHFARKADGPVVFDVRKDTGHWLIVGGAEIVFIDISEKDFQGMTGAAGTPPAQQPGGGTP